MATTYETCVVYLLGHPATGKRTVGGHLAALLDGVLVDNQLVNRPLLELFRWDGRAPIPAEVWDRADGIRDVVLRAIEDLAPASNSYVLTNVLEDDPAGAALYDRVRALAGRRGSLFLAVMLDCDIDVQVGRMGNPDRIALRKGSDPETYRRYRLETVLFQPPAAETLTLDTTDTPPRVNAERIHGELVARGFEPGG